MFIGRLRIDGPGDRARLGLDERKVKMADTKNLEKELDRLNTEFTVAEHAGDRARMEQIRKRIGQTLLLIRQAEGRRS